MYILLLLSAFFISGDTVAQWSTAGKSQIFTFSTTLIENGLTINWLHKRNETSNLTLFQCTHTGLMCDPLDDSSRELYAVNITTNATSVISVFTIKCVTPFHHNTTWFSLAITIKARESAQYNLNVFAVADPPICERDTVPNGINLQVNCFTEKAFPESSCVFYGNTNKSSESELKDGNVSYKHERNSTTGYYKTICYYNVSAAVVGPGSHIWRVVIYPNIPANITNEKSGGLNTVSIELYYPKAVLKAHCKVNEFIKENEVSQCGCYDNNTSVLPTTVIWSKCESKVCLNEILEFKAMRNISFQCTISNILNWKDTITFQPNVSYPPDVIEVKINNTELDICNDKNITLFGTCFVSESNPKPSVYIRINNSLNELTSIANSREYVINKRMISTGIFHITCMANSTEFSTTESNLTRYLTIKGPPENPTIFNHENKETNPYSGNVLDVTTGDTITCQSKGGYPLFKNVSLTCGHEENHAINQDQVNLTLNFSSTFNTTCECIVWHESKCLKNRTTSLIMYFVSENVPVTGNTEQDFEKIYLGVGVTAGCLVAVIVLIFIVSNLHQSKIQKISSDMADKLVNNGDLYFINQELSGFDMSIYPEYTNVVTTMSSAMEAPKNLKTNG